MVLNMGLSTVVIGAVLSLVTILVYIFSLVHLVSMGVICTVDWQPGHGRWRVWRDLRHLLPVGVG